MKTTKEMCEKLMTDITDSKSWADCEYALRNSKLRIKDSFSYLCTRACELNTDYRITFKPTHNELNRYQFYAEYWMLKAVNELRIPNRWKYKMLTFPNDEKTIINAVCNYMVDTELDFDDIGNDVFSIYDLHADEYTQRVFYDYQLFRHSKFIDASDKFPDSRALFVKLTETYSNLLSSYKPTLDDNDLDYLMFFITDEKAERFINKYVIGKLVASVYLYALSEFGDYLLPFVNTNGAINELQYDILRYIIKIMDLELQGYYFSLAELVYPISNIVLRSSESDITSTEDSNGVEKKARKLYNIIDKYVTKKIQDNYKYLLYLNVGEIVDRRMKIGLDDDVLVKLARF